MSYSDDIMQSLSRALRNSESLKIELKKFNDNSYVFERLANALEKQNELKEIELGLKNDCRRLNKVKEK